MINMKAVQMVGINKPLELQEIPIPDIGEQDILVKIKAAGICHSDVHYLKGLSPVSFLPITLGHEVAGVVEKIGSKVNNIKIGDRVCLHYMVTCGNCFDCITGNEQFCLDGKMIGHHINGGYAEYISIPARNAIHLPDEISFEQGATLMCASATSFHALLKARIKPGNTVAIFGVGGLGQSAIQLAKAFGATKVFAVDIDDKKLNMAKTFGAIPINNNTTNSVALIKNLTKNRGVDIAIEMIGIPTTQKQALQCAAPMARVVVVGLSNKILEVDTYKDILGSEIELIGSNNHRLQELPLLIEFASKKMLDTSKVVTKIISLNAEEINNTLEALERFDAGVRTVIVP